jgi:putative membrane protein
MKRFNWKAFAVGSVVALAACGPKTENAVDTAANSAGNVLSDAGDATANAIDQAGKAITPTPTGQEFADAAAKSDAFEIAAAKLAASHASSPMVKDFAKMMISAHTESTAKLKKAANAANPSITPAATLTKDQTDDLAELKALTGAKFDEEYIDGQVDAHEDALALMQKYAADGTVPSLKTAASEIAPNVKRHLENAKALDKD